VPKKYPYKENLREIEKKIKSISGASGSNLKAFYTGISLSISRVFPCNYE